MFFLKHTVLNLLNGLLLLVYPTIPITLFLHTGTFLHPTITNYLTAPALLTVIILLLMGPKHMTKREQIARYVITSPTDLKTIMIVLVITALCYTEPSLTVFNVGLRNPLASTHPTTLAGACLVALNLLTRCLQKGTAPAPTSSTYSNYLWKLTMAALLTVSLALSMWWAQQELFWGTFWNWDSVETSLLLVAAPVLLFIHLKSPLPLRNLLLTSELALITLVFTYYHNKSSQASSIHAFTNHTLSKITSSTIYIILLPILLVLISKSTSVKLSELKHTKGLRRQTPITTVGTVLTRLTIVLLFQFTLNLVSDQNIFNYYTVKSGLCVLICTHIILFLLFPSTTTIVLRRYAARYKHLKWWAGLLILTTLKLDLVSRPLQNVYAGLGWETVYAKTSQTLLYSQRRGAVWYIYTRDVSKPITIKNVALCTYLDSFEVSTSSIQKKQTKLIFYVPGPALTTLNVLSSLALMAIIFANTNTPHRDRLKASELGPAPIGQAAPKTNR